MMRRPTATVAAVVALAILVPTYRDVGAAATPCASSDGPQFRCWLQSLPATR